jgi:hypothetical protein
MVEANPGGDRSHVQIQILFATIVVKKDTKQVSANFIKESLQAKI